MYQSYYIGEFEDEPESPQELPQFGDLLVVRRRNEMNIKTAREVAARIWCDPEMELIEMDCELAEEIAQLLCGLPSIADDPDEATKTLAKRAALLSDGL